MRTFEPLFDRIVTSMSSPIMMLSLAFRVRTSTSLSSPTRSEFPPPQTFDTRRLPFATSSSRMSLALGVLIESRKLSMFNEAKMIETVKSPSARVLSKGCLALWLVVSLVFAALLLAADAQAYGTSAPNGAAEEAPPAAEESAPVVEQAPPAAEESAPVVEQAPPAAEETPPATEETPPATEETPPATEEAAPAAEETPPAAEESAPVVEQAPPVAEETRPVVEEGNVKQPTGEVASEAGSEGPATQETGGGSQAPIVGSRLTPEDAAGEVAPGEMAPGEVAPGVSAAATTSTAPAGISEIAARRTGEVSCEVDATGAPFAADRDGDWLDISAASSISTAPFATAVASPTAMTAGAPAGSDDVGSATENHPSAPTPGPGPGGAGGGSAAGSGSGSASSTSFTLVGLLLQAAPRAMWRLRLAQLSWRTSFFVLIPEQPD
jgi:hypothetical protein